MPSPEGCGLPCRKAVGADRPPAVPPPQSAAGEPPEAERIGAAGPFPFPHRRKGFAERCALLARRPVSFLRRRTPPVGASFLPCRFLAADEKVRPKPAWAGFSDLARRPVPFAGPPPRRLGKPDGTRACLPHDFQKKEGLSPREGCGMQNGIRNRYARRDRLRRRRSGGRHRCEVPLPQIRSGPAVAPRQSLGTVAALPAGLEAGRSASGRFPARAERVSIRPAAFPGRSPPPEGGGAARACGGRRRAGACVKRRYTANPLGRRSARSVWERLWVFGAKPQDKR